MIEIRPLVKLDSARLHEIGAGYASSVVYRVDKSEGDTQTTISLHLQNLEKPYRRRWPPDGVMDARYARVIEQGLALGAYDGNRAVGIVIAEKQAWNRTLWIWEFHIDPNYQKRGIGR